MEWPALERRQLEWPQLERRQLEWAALERRQLSGRNWTAIGVIIIINNNDVIFIGSFGFPCWGWGLGISLRLRLWLPVRTTAMVTEYPDTDTAYGYGYGNGMATATVGYGDQWYGYSNRLPRIGPRSRRCSAGWLGRATIAARLMESWDHRRDARFEPTSAARISALRHD